MPDFWTPKQIADFIGIEQAFEEFCEADPELAKLDSTRPDPKRNLKDFKEWHARYHAQYSSVHDAATERFVDPIPEETVLIEFEDLPPSAQAPSSETANQKVPLKERAEEWANRLEPAKNKKGGRRAVAKVIASETGLDHLYIEREARAVRARQKRGKRGK